MSGIWKQELGKGIVDYQVERPAADVSIPASTTVAAPQEILSFRVKPGRLPAVAAFRQAWDPAGDGSVQLALEVNNRLLFQYSGVQQAAPEAETLLPVFKQVEQNALVRVLGINSDGANPYNAVGVVVLYFFDHESRLFLPRGAG